MNKDFEKYIGKRVLCKSEYFAEEFLRLAHDKGWKWSNGKSLLERTYWEVYGKYTYYYVGEDKEINYGTTRQRSPYYMNEFIEYDPLCADKDVSLEEIKGENKMTKEERVKLVFKTFSKIVGFEIKPEKEFCVIIDGTKNIYKMGENFQLYYYYNWPLGNYNESGYNILAFFNDKYQFEEIKEPLLTEEGKNFLRQFKFDELLVTTNFLNMYNEKNTLVNAVNLDIINVNFDGLKESKRYSKAELRL